MIFDAENGHDAINKYNKYKPKLITIDITIPDIDGIKVIKYIMGKDKNAKIIVITTNYQEDTIIKSVQLGVMSYILKPITEDKIVNVFEDIFSEYSKYIKNEAFKEFNVH